MAFSLPSIKVKPELPEQRNVHVGAFGVPDVMTSGLASAKHIHDVPHPLMVSELNYHKNRDQMNMTVLRNTQGLHAPLKIAMELKAADKVGRFPFLQSSNIMKEVLTGKDVEIGFEDILGTPDFREVMGQPHAMVEKSLGIL